MSRNIRGERLPVGGPGKFILGKSEELPLLPEYASAVQLIYLDPPFGTGDTFSMAVGKKKLKVPVYHDNLSFSEYCAMMERVLRLCRELLSPTGSIYLHIDPRMSAHMRLLMDDIFGPGNFLNEIIWSYKSGGRSIRHYPRKHDNILFYRKSAKVYFDIAAIGAPRGAERRNHMKRSVDADGRVYYSIRSNGRTYKYYEDSLVYPSDVWDDIEHLHQRDPERTGYTTQKPEALLRRMILAGTREGDTVMDLFCGSGTAAAVASELGRRWVAADASPLALSTLRTRLLDSHAETSIFSLSHDMELLYGDMEPADIPAKLTLERSGAHAAVTLRSYGGKTQPAYMSAGHVKNGIFVPIAYSTSPRVGAQLELKNLWPGPLTVQLCDFCGEICFYEL